ATGAAHDVGEGSVFENFGRRVSHIEKHLIERAMLSVVINQATQLLSISKRRQWTVNQPDDFAQMDFVRRPTQLVSALGAASAFYDARVFQLEQNQFQKFLWKSFFISNVADADGSLVVVP